MPTPARRSSELATYTASASAGHGTPGPDSLDSPSGAAMTFACLAARHARQRRATSSGGPTMAIVRIGLDPPRSGRGRGALRSVEGIVGGEGHRHDAVAEGRLVGA